MKKLNKIKEELAKEKGYNNWIECINDHPNCMVETLMDIVALRLYNSKDIITITKKEYEYLKKCKGDLDSISFSL